MNEFLIYIVEANVALALFYLGYRFFLKDLTFYRLNRYYFLLAFIFASLYPAVDWLALFQERVAIPATMMSLAMGWEAVAIAEQSLSMTNVVEYLFWISAGVFTVRLLIQLSGIWRIHAKSTPSHWRAYVYRKSAEDIVPFSFWKNVYMNPDRHLENEYDQILEHEFVHVKQLHSLDILLTEFVVLFFWYNPFCWLLRSAVRENIEFITDRKVLASGVDRKSYQYSLLNISTLSNQPVMGNHFNLKNLKTRIMMMNKKRSSTAHLSKYALILPIVVAGSLVFGLSHAGESESLPMETKPFDFQVVADGNAEDKLAKNEIIHIKEAVHEDKQQDTLKKDTAKKTVLTGVGVKSDTSKQKPLYVLDGEIFTGKLDQIKPEDIERIEVLKGESAEALYGEKGKHGVIVVTTKGGSKQPGSITIRPAVAQDSVFSNPDVSPSPIGGFESFFQFVSENYRYPKAAVDAKVEGRVILQFVVEKDGSLVDIKTLRDLGHGTGEAAVRMLKTAPKWNPATRHGEPVRVQFTLPIQLNLAPADKTPENKPANPSD